MFLSLIRVILSLRLLTNISAKEDYSFINIYYKLFFSKNRNNIPSFDNTRYQNIQYTHNGKFNYIAAGHVRI